MKPVLIDLFCGAGGASMGYARAGFDIIGVDINPQPHYPFEFHQADALAFDVSGADALHASPPCQFGTAYRRRPSHVFSSPNLIPETRLLLQASGLPYIIENLWLNRSHLIDPVRLCGSSFGLDVQRHRAFECSPDLEGKECDHDWQTPRFPPATNRTNFRSTVEVGSYRCAHLSPDAMDIRWMTNTEISQAIPPAYTQHLGAQLIDLL